MATLGFGVCLIISIFVLIYMASKNYENINIYDWTIVIIVPIVILGYWLKSKVTSPEAAEIAFCFIYLDSTVLLMVSVFAMLHSFGVHVKGWIKLIGYGIALGHVSVVWLSYGTGLYYSSLQVTMTDAGSVTKMTSGPLKVVHIIYLALVICMNIGALIIIYARKNNYSRRIFYNYFVVAMFFIIVYAVESFVDVDFTSLPYLYTLSSVIIALNYDRMHLHDISCIISQQQRYFSRRGYVALNLKLEFMSCNEKAFEFVPFLKNQRVDEKLPQDKLFFNEMVEKFCNEGVVSSKYKLGEMICICEVSEISFHRAGKAQGYLFDIRDATEEQKAMEIMSSYNETLNTEIEKKTENIVEIQRKITVGMANIIENRDNNTGGHVKRTSDVIRIIVNNIMEQGIMDLDRQLAEDIVRAAPMHDLGKISIDSYILCKPGRLTDEEYQIMKTHSAKSGEMVHILLDGVEEQHFVNTAFHIARYHHERWDGKGYPDGLVGTMIPIEARIMAVADVYDALVSKRCYKESMSFAQAKEIMLQGMGTQFDPNMRTVFLNCCDELEAYYRNIRYSSESDSIIT